MDNSFFRIAAASLKLKVADVDFNTSELLNVISEAAQKGGNSPDPLGGGACSCDCVAGAICNLHICLRALSIKAAVRDKDQ